MLDVYMAHATIYMLTHGFLNTEEGLYNHPSLNTFMTFFDNL